MNAPDDRTRLGFVRNVRETFTYLTNEGFAEIEALPTLVRFRKGEVEVDIYHGRQSYEIGGGVKVAGVRYSMSEIVRATDPEVARSYRNYVATTTEEVSAGLKELSALVRRYGARVLQADRPFCLKLEKQRERWADEYALDVLETQLRPQAEQAFRRGDYSRAAELYGRIRERLTPAEAKKLAIADERRRD